MSKPWDISSMELGRRLERCKLDAVLIANQWGPQEHEVFMRNAVERVEELQLWLDGWNRDKPTRRPDDVCDCDGECKHADKYAKAYAAKCAQRRAKRGNR